MPRRARGDRAQLHQAAPTRAARRRATSPRSSRQLPALEAAARRRAAERAGWAAEARETIEAKQVQVHRARRPSWGSPRRRSTSAASARGEARRGRAAAHGPRRSSARRRAARRRRLEADLTALDALAAVVGRRSPTASTDAHERVARELPRPARGGARRAVRGWRSSVASAPTPTPRSRVRTSASASSRSRRRRSRRASRRCRRRCAASSASSSRPVSGVAVPRARRRRRRRRRAPSAGRPELGEPRPDQPARARGAVAPSRSATVSSTPRSPTCARPGASSKRSCEPSTRRSWRPSRPRRPT